MQANDADSVGRHTSPRAPRERLLTVVGAVLLAWASCAAPATAQWTAELRVEEPGGIRRTAFPARARLEIPRGRLVDATRVRLVGEGSEVPVQGTARSSWPDGSVRALEVDFNVSLGPLESRNLSLSYGTETPAPDTVPRGLVVTREAGDVRVGRLVLDGSAPRVRSVAYRDELVVPGRNGLAVLDDRGVWHRSEEIVWEPVEIVKGGPLTVLLAYRGRLPTTSGGDDARITVELEMPNSKSWLRMSASVSAPDRSVRAVAIETPLRLGEHPWSWDFGTPNGTYGAFREDATSVVFNRADSGAWQVRTGPTGEERPYEEGVDTRPAAGAWVHLVGAREAVAFAVATGDVRGTLTARLSGTGQTSFGFEPAGPVDAVGLTLVQHYVSTPLPIGAATSPASILSPLRVSVR